MNKHRVIKKFIKGRKVYVVESQLLGLFWVTAKEPNAMGTVIHEHQELALAIEAATRLTKKSFTSKLKEFRISKAVCSTGAEQFYLETKGMFRWSLFINDDLGIPRYNTEQEAEAGIVKYTTPPDFEIKAPLE